VSRFPVVRALRERAPIIIAHRGVSSEAPENTLAAFALAKEHHIPAVELDIHRCGSGELVVIHDESMHRTAGVNLPVRETPLSSLREHSVGSWFAPRYESERIPLLSEVVDLLDDDQMIDIEIKPPGVHLGRATEGSVEERLADFIRDRALQDRVMVSSFDPLVIRRFARLLPMVARAVIYAEAKELPRFLRRGFGRVIARAAVLKPHSPQATPNMIAAAHRRGRAVAPWTIDDPGQAVELANSGADAIITNRPIEIAGALEGVRA
jgi:glycerophosphoryl diester phosphodiesterase